MEDIKKKKPKVSLNTPFYDIFLFMQYSYSYNCLINHKKGESLRY